MSADIDAKYSNVRMLGKQYLPKKQKIDHFTTQKQIVQQAQDNKRNTAKKKKRNQIPHIFINSDQREGNRISDKHL